MTGTFIVIFAVIVAIWAAWVAWQVAKEGGHNPYRDSSRDSYSESYCETPETNPRWPFPVSQTDDQLARQRMQQIDTEIKQAFENGADLSKQPTR